MINALPKCLKRLKKGGDPKWIKVSSMPKIGEYELKLLAHNGSSFKNWSFLTIQPAWCKILNQIKTAKSLIIKKIVIGLYDVEKIMKENHILY